MTPEQLTAIVAVGDSIRANPVSWDALAAPARATLEAALMPEPSFVPLQRDYLSRWWLPVTAPQLAALNAACPADTVLIGRPQTGGQLYVCADLLSDALQGGRLAGLLPVLRTLTLTHFLPAEWPNEDGSPGVEIVISDLPGSAGAIVTNDQDEPLIK